MTQSKKIRNSARGESCSLRLIEICNYTDETVVLAHVGHIRGMGLKCDDSFAVYACSDCHRKIDGEEREEYALDILRALEETQSKLFAKGLLKHA